MKKGARNLGTLNHSETNGVNKALIGTHYSKMQTFVNVFSNICSKFVTFVGVFNNPVKILEVLFDVNCFAANLISCR